VKAERRDAAAEGGAEEQGRGSGESCCSEARAAGRLGARSGEASPRRAAGMPSAKRAETASEGGAEGLHVTREQVWRRERQQAPEHETTQQ